MEKSAVCIEFFDLDLGKKIENGRAEIKNVDNKTTQICTIVNGKLTLHIDKEHIADFHSVCLICDDGSKQYPYNLAIEPKELNGQNTLTYTTQKLINARSYAKCNARLYFKPCETPTNQYKVGIIKCYKVVNDEGQKRQEVYHYCKDSKDEIFVADCEQTVAFQAYFYRDLEIDKLLSQKNRKILANETMQAYINVDEIQWFINDIELKGDEFKSNLIFVNFKDFGFKEKDILSIQAKLKSQSNNYIIKRKMPYKEPFKANGKLLIDDSERDKIYKHTVIDALGQMHLAIEHRSALVYDYRGLFLYENRREVCKLDTNNDINDKKIEKLNDYIDFNKKRYKAEISDKTSSTISIYIEVNANQKIPLKFNCNNNDALSFFNNKQIKSIIPFIYYKPTQYVIFINRHTQTPKYTLSDYQILKRQENGEYELVAQENIAKGVILEPCGPDGLLAGTVLRIPEGHYKIMEKGTKMESLRTYYSTQGQHSNLLPKLYDDEFVLSGSHKNKRTEILIHSGTNVLESPLDRTEGCLLIGREFKNGELITHSNSTVNLSEMRKKLEDIAKERKTSLSIISNKRLNKDEEEKEIKQLNKKFYNKDGEHYKNNIEPYINASIRMLMEFINKNAIKSKYGKNRYENFSIHIKNNFSKGEYDVRMG